MVYFSCSDHDDNPIECSDETWDHIVENRDIMEGCEDIVKAALRAPDVITRGRNQCECWYRRGDHPEAPNDYIKVVVRFQDAHALPWKTGSIVTAFLAGAVNPREEILWSR